MDIKFKSVPRSDRWIVLDGDKPLTNYILRWRKPGVAKLWYATGNAAGYRPLPKCSLAQAKIVAASLIAMEVSE
jgi:hypothetical protein